MMGRNFEDSHHETLAKIRERVAGLDQRLTSSYESQQRELTSLRHYFDEKLIAQKIDLKTYIDQKFIEMGNSIGIKTPVTSLDPRFWILVVLIGIFSAGTFIAFTWWLVSIQNGG